PADAMLRDGTLELYERGERLRGAAAERAWAGKLDEATDLYREAILVRRDDHLAWRGLALLDERRSRREDARAKWSRVLALSPDSPKDRRHVEERVSRVSSTVTLRP